MTWSEGTDFPTIANAKVAKVDRVLNARPRKCFGFRSLQEFSAPSFTHMRWQLESAKIKVYSNRKISTDIHILMPVWC
jgi:hypothetical protein